MESKDRLKQLKRQYHESQYNRLEKDGIFLKFSDLTGGNKTETEILIGINTNRPIPKLEGMQIIFFENRETSVKYFEVSEYQAGPNGDNMFIYQKAKTLKSAVTSLLKGNKDFCKRKPIEII